LSKILLEKIGYGTEGKRLIDRINEALRMIEWFLNHIVAMLSSHDVTMIDGETYQIVLNVTPSDATLTYKSSNSSVVTIDSNGLVTAEGVGDAEVTVTCTKSGYKTARKVITFHVVSSTDIRIVESTVENSATQEWDEYGVADYAPQGIEFELEQGYTTMPYSIVPSWFVDTGGLGVEVTAPIDFRVILVKELIDVGGSLISCYSKVQVLPFSTALPSTISYGKISVRLLCKGAVAKPEV
jgi:hypothetical protein